MPDLSITAGQVQRVSGAIGVIQLGEAVTAGMVIYKKGSDAKAWKGVSSSAAAAAAIGIVLCDGAAEQWVAYAKPGAVVDLGAGAAPAKGETYSVSDTAGGLQPDVDVAASEWVTRVCEGLASNRVQLTCVKTGIQHA